jgi:predicted phosphohydrolase
MSKIKDYKPLFDGNFDDWYLTGSQAVKIYYEKIFNVNVTFKTDDINLVVPTRELFYKTEIGHDDYTFIREQNIPQRSVRYISTNHISFDVVSINKPPSDYYLINGIKILTPEKMYENYEFYSEDRDCPKDFIIMSYLSDIIKHKIRLDKYLITKKISGSKRKIEIEELTTSK